MAAVYLRRNASSLILGLAYLALSCVAIRLTRFHGGVAFISVANAVLLAFLLTSRPSRWFTPVIVCAIAGIFATSVVGLGLAAAVPMAPINVGEALVAAAVCMHFSTHRSGLGSKAPLPAFLLAAGVVAPMVSAFGGAVVATSFGADTYLSNWFHWFSGHALGLLTFTPIVTYLLRGDAKQWLSSARQVQMVEFSLHLLLVAAVAIGVFAQSSRPLLFLPMLPIILATFRTERIAAACALVIVAVVGGGFTIAGYGPISVMAGSTPDRILFLQFYLACTVVTVLPIAAELARRASLYRQLHDSEARYRLLTENSTDVVLNLDVEGRIRYASPSIRQIGGYRPEDVIGESALDLVDPADMPAVAGAHAAALRDPSRTFIVEYRGTIADGTTRWFESHTRATLDEEGATMGAVCAVRDVSHRKSLEESLVEATLTDQLTGLANRGAFEARLAAAIASANAGAGGGCVALFDLDHFKQVNDHYGHAAGDAVLRRFAEIGKSRLRGDDLLARHGGEEFAVLLSDASLHQAQLVCDRIRTALAETITLADGNLIKVTVSGGVSRFEVGSDSTAVVAAADLALYRAKAAGRDQLALAA